MLGKRRTFRYKDFSIFAKQIADYITTKIIMMYCPSSEPLDNYLKESHDWAKSALPGICSAAATIKTLMETTSNER